MLLACKQEFNPLKNCSKIFKIFGVNFVFGIACGGSFQKNATLENSNIFFHSMCSKSVSKTHKDRPEAYMIQAVTY